jgi:hypothetical protein
MGTVLITVPLPRKTGEHRVIILGVLYTVYLYRIQYIQYSLVYPISKRLITYAWQMHLHLPVPVPAHQFFAKCRSLCAHPSLAILL